MSTDQSQPFVPPIKISNVNQVFASHPLISCLLLAFIGTWLLNAPLVLGKDGLGFFQYQVPLPVSDKYSSCDIEPCSGR